VSHDATRFLLLAAVNLRCHPERDAFCLAKDLSAPRGSPAFFAGGQTARLARFRMTDYRHVFQKSTE
jgi:hypothetical protein